MSHSDSQTLETGVVFAANDAKQRSSTTAAKNVLTAALQSLALEDATDVHQERQWRTRYPRYFKAWVEGALLKPEHVARSAQSALSAAMDSLCWASRGKDIALSELFASLKSEGQASRFDVKTLVGGQPVAAGRYPLVVPYRGKLLSGQALAEQARSWAVRGVIESSAAQAIIRCAENPRWFDLSDRTLVLLGAGSEAGPLKVLSKWKANIVAIDLPRPHVWARIAAIVEGGNSTVHVPLSREGTADWTARAGADLLTELPEIARWMRGFKGPLDVAAHGYADGEKHLRLAAAMDVLQALACHDHEASTLAFMATPTDVYAVPQGAAAASMARYRQRPLVSKALQQVLAQFTSHRFFRPNVEAMVSTPSDAKYAVVDSLVIQQGPNYALAKRLQQWRGLVARSAGHRVSINVAPPTETSSVLSNRAIAAGYRAADVFGVEVFQPETTTALMAALWVHDLRTGNEADTASAPSAHPLDLIAQGACHGGFWPVAYCPRTALPFVAGLGFLRGALADLKKRLGKGRPVGGLDALARAK